MSGRRLPALRTSSTALVVAVCLVAGSHCAQAQQGDIYKCVDDRGQPVYGNVGSGKGCTKITVEPVVVPKLANPSKTSGSPTPGGFPKVDGTTQRARDSDRRRILEDELHDKEARLTELKRQYNNGEPERQGDERNYQRYLDRTARLKEDVARAESDVASIRSEIGKIQ